MPRAAQPVNDRTTHGFAKLSGVNACLPAERLADGGSALAVELAPFQHGCSLSEALTGERVSDHDDLFDRLR